MTLYPKRTHLQSSNRILHIPPSILRQRLGQNQHRLSKRIHSQLCSSLRQLLDVVVQMSRQGDLEGTGSGNEGLVLDGVLDSSESVSESVVDLGDGVLVGS